MQTLLRDISIKRKLALLVMFSTIIALTLCCIGFALHNVRTMRKSKVKELQVQAGIIAFNSTAVLTFKDAGAAEQLLASLSLQPTVEYACLIDEDKQVLAEYSKTGDLEIVVPPIQPGHRYSNDGKIVLFRSIHDNGEEVGTLFLCANTVDLQTQLWAYAKVAFVIAVVSLLFGMIFSYSMQRTITEPILELTELSKKVSLDGDYSIRLTKGSNDELGMLFDSFNYMLQQIQNSESELQLAHDQLEDRVKQRTAQLRAEIAERKNTEQALLNAKNAAESANIAKSHFLANMSHEIRTPLNAVLGFTELLRRGADNGREADRQEYLETIHTSGVHLLALINDILDLSKVEAGQMEVEQVQCSPHDIVAEVVSVLRVRAKEKGLRLTTQWPEGVPQYVNSDPSRLRQLLMNLIGNSIKFTKRGAVTISARLLDKELPPKLEFAIQDTGVGIPADKLEAIFDPFVQADTSVTREFGGTGLGLAISRQITQALGGNLTADSVVGTGSIFRATIDIHSLEGIRILDTPPSDGVSGCNRQVTEKITQLPSGRILLVEDGDTNRKLIRLILGRAGADVVEATNGKIGVELATSQPFDLILMDMQMPVMDGYTAASLLREHGLQIPIIALTAHAMKGDSEKCTKAGCSGYLAKPVEADLLLQTVSQILEFKHGDATEDGTGETAEKQTAIQACDYPIGSPLCSSLPTEDPDFCEIVIEFIQRFREKLDDIKKAKQAKDYEQLASLAHWLKGSGGTAGFQVFTEPASRLEIAAKEENYPEVKARISEISALAARVEEPVGEAASSV